MVCAAACSLAPITCDPWVDLRSSPRLDALTWLASGGADSSLIEASVAVNAVGGVPLSSELLTAVIGVAWLAYAASVFRQAPASTRKRSALFLVFLLMVAVRTVLSNGVVRQLELGSSAPGTCLWVQSHDSATAPLIALIGVVFLDWSDTTSKAFSREDLAAGAAILLVGIPASVFYYFTAQSAALGPSETFDWHIVAGLSILIGLLLGLWAARSEITKRCRRARSCKPRWDDWLDLFQLLAFPLLFALLNIDSSETEGCPPWSFKGRSLGQSPLAPPGAHWPEGMDPASPAARARVLDAIEAKAALSLAISANTIALILAQLLRSHSEASSVAELEAQAAASELRLAVGSVSHEARGPLNSAMLSLGLFDDSAPPAARAVIANDLRAAILASKRQLDELNAWDEGAAAARGRKADPTWAPMGGLSRALLMRFGGACRSAGIKLNLSLSGAKCATWKSTRARRRSPDARGGAAGAEHAAASSAFCSAAVSDAKAMTGADSAASASAAAAASGAAAAAAAGTTSTHRAGPSCEPLEGSRPAGCEPAFGTEPPLVAARSASLASVQVAGGATADSLVLEGMEPVRGWEVLLDHDLLVSAVANAVSNAVKHSPYGSGRIGVAVACAVGKQFTLASGMQEPHDPAMRRHGSATSSASGASARRQDAGSGMLAAAASASPPRSGGHRSAAADAGASPRPPLTPDVQVALPGVLHVEVHDNGRGIPAAMLREGALFTPFARLRDGDESLRMSSSGLGLSIMRRCVVDGLGGLVGLASREGRGTTTYIRVPALFRRPAQAAEGVGGCPASGGGGAAESGNDGTEAPLEAGMSREAAADGGAVEKQPSAHGGSEAGSDSAASDWSGDGSERTPSEREAARQERAARRAMRRGERQRSRAPDSHAGSCAAFTRAASAGPDPARRREVNIPGWLVGQLAYVVDDERTNRTLMAHLLRRWGLRVETFEDGRQLMDALTALGRKPHEDATAGPATPTHPAPGKRLWTASASASAARGMAATNLPAIIMLDIEMPRLDGFGALAEMNGMVAAGTLPFRPPVIVVTGNTRARDRMRLEELGCRSIVFKPYDQDSLLAEVRKLRPGKRST
ncbi:hypothetical protein FNF28_03157 [Cafeteria roenbergensis]|uniref:histidine kinase n=1 Tax=Cafeteria roenbergensis TaxID=33653 RepID=A0A5A8DMD7_CAFRO|nr:hypothetical protein FNF28_03157 [Cafeteria roenbergensis]